MGPDRRLVAPLVGLVAVLGILGCLCWIRWPHEYRGVLKDNTGAVGIPEDPLPPAYLVTATGTHELAFSERGISFWKSNWRSKLQELDGREVILHGSLPTWRRRWRRNAQIIQVYDLEPCPSAMATAPQL